MVAVKMKKDKMSMADSSSGEACCCSPSQSQSHSKSLFSSSPQSGSLFSRVRESQVIIIIMVFVGLLTDNLLLTLVDPILPDIINRIENGSDPGLNVTLPSEFINSNGRYGYLVAAKGATQFICNPFVGITVTRFGYRIPMFLGSAVLMGSTVGFAYSESYLALFLTRMLQGASSSITAVTGMGLLASRFTDDHERGRVMGIAIGGISIGIIIGPLYGSILYQFVGVKSPFLVLSGMILIDMTLQLISFQDDSKTLVKCDHSMASLCLLLADPYILITAGAVFLLNLNVSMILAFLPIHLIDLEDPETWELGIVVLPTSIGYLFSSIVFPRTTKWIARWSCGLWGLIFSAVTMAGLAFCDTFVAILVDTTFLGIALGMVSTSMQPIFAELVDLRHSNVYGNAYAISDMAVCAAFFVGPLAGGEIMFRVGFKWLILGIAVLNLAFSQFCYLLKDPPPKEKKCKDLPPSENSSLLNSAHSSYSSRRSSASVSVTGKKKLVSDLPMPRCLDYYSSMEELAPTKYEIEYS